MLRLISHFIDLDKLNEDSIVLDAGASEGCFIEELLKHVNLKNENIYAIEASKRNYETCLKDKPYTVLNAALMGSDREEETIEFAEFIGLPGWGNSFSINEGTKHPKLEGFETFNAPVLKICDVFEQFGIDRIDFMKLDIIGGEKEVLETIPREIIDTVTQITIEVYIDVWSLGEAESTLHALDFETITDPEKNELYGYRK
jgi:FkbM family methyltransferase